MESLTIDRVTQYLLPFANKEILTPGEATRLCLILTELLVEHTVDVPLMKFLSRFFTQEIYEDIIEERNIEHLCGYLLCDQKPRGKLGLFKFDGKNIVVDDPRRFNQYERDVYKKKLLWPRIYISSFCNRDHYRASLFYRNQLSDEAIFARKDIMIAPPFPSQYPDRWYEKNIICLEEVLAKHDELKEEGKTLSEVVSMMSGLEVSEEKEKETDDLVKLIKDLEIVEKEGGVFGDDIYDNSDDDENANGNPQRIESYSTTTQSFGQYI